MEAHQPEMAASSRVTAVEVIELDESDTVVPSEPGRTSPDAKATDEEPAAVQTTEQAPTLLPVAGAENVEKTEEDGQVKAVPIEAENATGTSASAPETVPDDAPAKSIGPATDPNTIAKTFSIAPPPIPPSPPRPPPLMPAPLRGIPVPGTRPTTSSTTRSLASVASSKRRQIKYGKGKHARVELVPQPSDDDDDPLNWPMWKKDLNFAALLVTVALVGVMKTALVSVNVPLEQVYAQSYTAIAGLTGGPLLVSALSGMVALIASRLWGKRPVYLAGMVTLLIGSAWNVYPDSFAQCLVARIFQGLGWGVFDSLVLGSIHDTYFEHERNLRIAIHQVVAVAATWGGPLLGGVVSQHTTGFRLQFQILSCFQIASVLLLVFAAPETVFDRHLALVNRPTPLTAASGFDKQLPLRPRRTLDLQQIREYIRANAMPCPYAGPGISARLLLQAPRALVAPTTLLVFLASLLPFGTLWALASSLSLMFAHLPFELSPSSVGVLMAAPFIMGAGTAGFFAFVPWWHRKFFPHMHMAAVGGGSVLVFAAVLTMGLYAEMSMTSPPMAEDASASASSPFMIGGVSSRLSLPSISFLLGLLATGAYALDATVRPLIKRSTQFTSSNLRVALRNTVDMDVGVGLWRSMTAGVFVLATPNLVWSWPLLRAMLMGIGTAQLGVAAALGAVWWLYDEHIRRLDGRVMKCVDMSMLKRTGSFFDTD